MSKGRDTLISDKGFREIQTLNLLCSIALGQFFDKCVINPVHVNDSGYINLMEVMLPKAFQFEVMNVCHL